MNYKASFHHPVVKFFHWLVILGVFIQFGLCYSVIWFPELMTPYKNFIFMLHKSTGNLMVLVVLGFVCSAFYYGRPLHNLPKVQLWLAYLVKFILIMLLLTMSMSGYMMTSAGGYHYSFYNLFDVPLISGLSKEIGAFAYHYHGLGATLLLIFIGMHTLAALFHHFVNKDQVLRSMFGKDQ